MSETYDSDHYDPSFWLRSVVDDLGDRLAERTTRPCPHLTHPERDRYAWCLWMPERLVCADCLPAVMDAPRGMCNRCGKAEPVRENYYHPTPEEDWVLIFVLCADCQRAEMPDA
jgi:hypothetical protein